VFILPNHGPSPPVVNLALLHPLLKYESYSYRFALSIESDFSRIEEVDRKRAEEAAAKNVLTAEEEEELANAPPPVLPYSSMFIFSSTNGFR
jgi:hypothetical protein